MCLKSVEMITKYRDKVKSLESRIEAIQNEEEAEKIIAKAEIEANKAIRTLEAKSGKKKMAMISAQRDHGQRLWFQSHKDRSDGKIFLFFIDVSHCPLNIYLILTEKSRLKGKRLTAKEREKAMEAAESLKLKKIAEFQARVAKRKRRNKLSEIAQLGSVSGKKLKKRKSHFEDELTNTKAAREFRHSSKHQVFKGGSQGQGQGRRPNLNQKNASQRKSTRKFNEKVKRH